MGLEPDAEALIVNRIAEPPAVRDRADRRVLPAGRPDQGELGGDLRRRRARAGDRRRSSTSCAERARERRAGDGQRPPAPATRGRARRRSRGAPDPDFEVLSARAVERAAAPTLGFRVRVSDASGAARSSRSRSPRVITIEPSKRPYDRRQPRAPGRAVRRARALGLDDDQLPLGPGRRAGAGVQRRRPSSSSPSPCTYDLELAAAKYFHGLADGAAPLRFHFNGTVFYEADDGRMQIVQIPWDRSPRFEMPVEVWRADDRRRTTRTAAGSRCTPRRSTRLRAAQGRARAADLRRRRSTSCSTGGGG